MTIKELEEEMLEARGAWLALQECVSDCKHYKKGRHHIEYLQRQADKYERKMNELADKYDSAMSELLK